MKIIQKAIGRKDRDEDLSETDDQGHHGAVEEEPTHLEAVPDAGIILPEMARRKKNLGVSGHLLHALGADDQTVVQREADQAHGEKKQQVDDELVPIPPLRAFQHFGCRCHQ